MATTSIRLFAAAAFLWCAPADADWPAWRGPTADGIAPDKDPPLEWSAGRNVLWKAPLPGNGVSTPIVKAGRVLLTASDGREHDRIHVLAFDAGSGTPLWHRRFFGTSAIPQNMYPPGGTAVPSIAVDDSRLFALFGTGDLICLDFDGRPVWIRSLAAEYGPFMNRWGMAASPVVFDGAVLVQVDRWGGSYLLCVDGATGATRWKVERDAAVNWTTPVIVRNAGKAEIVCAGTQTLKGYDPASGRELWTLTALQEQCIPTPVVSGDVLYAVSGRKGNSVALRLDGARGELSQTQILWRNPRGAPNIPSAVCDGRNYYVVEDDGIATCLDAATGELRRQARLGGKFRASPVIAAGRVYFTSMDGVTTVVRADGGFDQLARNELGEGVTACPAFSDNRIFLRGEKHLFCIGK
jgi:outer membrane protein assembly factor BamB